MAEIGPDGFRVGARSAARPAKASALFHAPSQVEVVEGIVSDILGGRAVVAVRGERGVGKTTQMRVIASKLGMRQRTVVMTDAVSISPSKVLRLLGEAAGFPDAAALAPDRLLEIMQASEVIDRLVLLVDDADQLSSAMFRYLGLLIELFDFRPIKLQLVLFGLPGQWPGLQEPDLELMRQAAFSRHIIHAPTASTVAPPNMPVNQAFRFPSQLSDPQGGWRRRASIAALCLLFVAGAGITFLVNQAEAPPSLPVRATRPLAPTPIVTPPAEAPAPEKPAEIEETATMPGMQLPTPQETQTAERPSVHAQDEVRAARRGGPGLVLVAGAGDDLPDLYAKVYRGLKPPPYPQVVAVNRTPLKPGALVIFPEPPSGWPSR